MHIRAISLIALTLAITQNAPSPVSPPQVKINPGLIKAFGNYGGWWAALSDDAKDSYVDGYRSAMSKAQSLTYGTCMKEKDAIKPGADFDTQMKEVIILCSLAQEFDFKVDKPMKGGLDDFYKDPANTRITDFIATAYVRDQLQGKKTAGQLLDELNDWRKIMNRNSSKDK
jgi:hypothetical protein